MLMTALAFAQDAAPSALRLRADQGTVTKYGGKTDQLRFYAFSFATGPGGARLPDDLRDRLKLAFERDFSGSSGLDSGKTLTVANSTETILEARDDGSRVVQVESYTQSTGLVGLGQTADSSYLRTHAPDGGVSLGDVKVKIETAQPFLSDEVQNAKIIASLEQSVRFGAIIQAEILTGCFQAAPGAVSPLMIDPRPFMPSANSGADASGAPDGLQPVRLGDLRLERTAEGGADCRVSLEPKRYGVGSEMYSFVSRQRLQFLPDGRVNHSESVSSTSINRSEATDFEFESRIYRVRYALVFRSQGSSDRLD